MTPLVCPHCRRTNPAAAVYCYFDGVLLQAGGGAGAPAAGALAREFVFPSGRQCRTYDELLQGCQEEWQAARELLRGGAFEQFFAAAGRHDLARAAAEGRAQADPDIGLTNFLAALPGASQAQGPRLDLTPRRLALGKMLAGESRTVPLKVLNRGQGLLQGTLSVTEGDRWLRLGAEPGNGHLAVKTTREQQVPLHIDTRGLPAGQTYGGKLRVITNGGVVEAPVQVEVVAHLFPREPFRGARTPREMAQKMRHHPKVAVPLLEGGELARWFGQNGWPYPVPGPPAKGVAGVQQFFEAMGLSKPPAVRLYPGKVQLTCHVPERPRFQVSLQGNVKKFVYGTVRSDVPWLNVLTPEVSGPQQAVIAVEVDPRHLPRGAAAEAAVQVTANGGQPLTLPVRVDVVRPPVPARARLLTPVLAAALTLLLLRLLLAPVVDFVARPAAVAEAARQVAAAGDGAGEGTARPLPPDAPALSLGGWLRLPWAGVLLGQDYRFPDGFFGSGRDPAGFSREDFHDQFTAAFVRLVVLATGWAGALAWVVTLYRRGGFGDALWGVLSGLVFGIVLSATLACAALLLDLAPLWLWHRAFGDGPATAVHLALWSVLAAVTWGGMGAALAALLLPLGPVGRPVLRSFEALAGWLLRPFGLAPAAEA